MADRFKRNIFTIAGVFIGAVAGLLYWKFIGCASGTCPLTSSWKIMLAYGAVTGGLLGNMAQGFIKKKETAK